MADRRRDRPGIRGMVTLADDLKRRARELGFAEVGIAPATDADSFDAFSKWIDAGRHGEMEYLAEKREHRRHPRAILKNVKSVVMVALEYADSHTDDDPPRNHGRVARYARGPDYHRLMWDKLEALDAWLRSRAPCEIVTVTDTAPLLERDFARRAGLGWVGKNTMLIHPKRGSFFFLGALLTDLELPVDAPFETNHCGSCTACLDACPTAAFPQPGTLDATKCISYLTIEHRTPIALPLRDGLGDWLFGCDVCQEVCPWNRFAGRSAESFPHDPNWTTIDAVRLLTMTETQYRLWFKGMSFRRTKLDMLRRNAAIVLGNHGDATALPTLDSLATDESPMVRDAAAWAGERIRGQTKIPAAIR
jgi:epoxyqueuosine reductase